MKAPHQPRLAHAGGQREAQRGKVALEVFVPAETRCGSPPASPQHPPLAGRGNLRNAVENFQRAALRRAQAEAAGNGVDVAVHRLRERGRGRGRGRFFHHGQVFHLQGIIVMPPLAARQHLLGNLLHRQIGIGIGLGAEGGAQHQQRPIRPHLVGELLQLLVGQAGGGHIDEIALGGMAVLPIHRIRRRIAEALQLAQRLGQHGGVVVVVDDPVAPLVLFQQRRRQAVVAEAATALPAHCFGNAAGVFAVDDLLQARNDMRMTVLAQLDHDPAPAHLVGDGASGAGAGEGVEDEVAGVGGDVDDPIQKPLRLWRVKGKLFPKQNVHFLLRLVGMSSLLVWPPCIRDNRCRVFQILFERRNSIATFSKVRQS
jgi:hypothetical protein